MIEEGRSMIAKSFAGWALAVTLVLCSAVTQADTIGKARSTDTRILPFDVHLDIDPGFDGPQNPATVDGATQFDLPKVARGGVKAAGLAVFAPQEADSPEAFTKARSIAEAKHRAIAGLAAHYPDRVALAFTPNDVRRIAGEGKLAIVETVVNGGALVDSLDDLDLWARRGVRIFGFVHAGHNRLADSSRPALTRGEGTSRNGGLSPLGRQAVERLNRLGVLIDVSQLSDAAFDEVLRLTKAPVIASHSDIRTLVDNSRNLTDAQLDALKGNGGVIAINAFSAYLRPGDPAIAAQIRSLQQEFGIGDGKAVVLTADQSATYLKRYLALHAQEPKASVQDLVNAVDYAVKRIGIDHVGLSSDFNHGGGIIGWKDEGEARNVTAELARRGYSQRDIAKLWSGNVLRAWEEAQREGRRLRQ
jgi:membrane dipeptidase